MDAQRKGPSIAAEATVCDGINTREVGRSPFSSHRGAALALLSSNVRLSRKAGQFLGQLAADAAPMTDAQADWLSKLLDRAGLPPLVMGVAL